MRKDKTWWSLEVRNIKGRGRKQGKKVIQGTGIQYTECGENRRWRREIICTEQLVDNDGFAHKEIILEDNDVYLEKTVYIYE